jgi:chaperonin GroES
MFPVKPQLVPRIRSHICDRAPAKRPRVVASAEAGHRSRQLESSAMQIRPLHDRVLIQRLDEGEQNVGGIIIPDSAKDKPQRGTVIAAGNGRPTVEGRRVALDVKEGDTVLFGKYSGQEIKLEGVEYLIMKEDELLAAIGAGVIKDAGTRSADHDHREKE